MSDFVLVRHDNGLISPVSRALAERRKLAVVDGDPLRPNGRPVKATRGNGRPVKPKVSVAEKKAAGKKAVVPSEGAADSALSDTTTKEN